MECKQFLDLWGCSRRKKEGGSVTEGRSKGGEKKIEINRSLRYVRAN